MVESSPREEAREGPKAIAEMTRDDLRVYHVPGTGHCKYWVLKGCVSDRDGYIHKHLAFNKFEKQATKIPDNAERQDTPCEAVANCWFDPSKRKLVASILEFPQDIVPQGTAYKIVDNGGISFVCYINDDNAGQGATRMTVYRKPSTGYIDEDEWLSNWKDFEKTRLYYQDQVCVFETVEQVYIGVDNEANIHGNSMLLRLSTGEQAGSAFEETEKYVFVGWEIYSFSLKRQDRVTEYFSRMGNNSVPYPVALTDEFVIFMLDAVCLPREEIAPYIDNEEHVRPGLGEKITWDDSYYVFCGDRLGQLGEKAKQLTATPLNGHEVLVARDIFG